MPIVSFIGAGPGDPELLTLKAVDRIRRAGLILYAGSLVPPEVFENHSSLPADKVINTAPLTLEEILNHIKTAIGQGDDVARIHTGDPSIYGAIYEQIALLDNEYIPFEIIPGISSAMASAAALQTEFTVPNGAQTIIFTRMEGRTPVPASESLDSLASHKATMVVFLSAHLASGVQDDLLKHYAQSTPAAVVYRVGWPDQKIFRTTVSNIAETMENNGIKKQALILVGDAFAKDKRVDIRSILYGKEKRHKPNES